MDDSEERLEDKLKEINMQQSIPAQNPQIKDELWPTDLNKIKVDPETPNIESESNHGLLHSANLELHMATYGKAIKNENLSSIKCEYIEVKSEDNYRNTSLLILKDEPCDYTSDCTQTSFSKNCLNVNEKVEYIGDDAIESMCSIKYDDVEIKSEENYTDASLQNLKDELVDRTSEGQSENMKTTNCSVLKHKMEQTGSKDEYCELKQSSSFEQELYKCDSCNFKTSLKNSFIRHQLCHKDVPKKQKQLYKCDSCNYKTKSRYCLNRHQLYHKDIPEEQMHKCDLCDYKTIVKSYFTRHQLIHKDVPEEQMYKCDLCDYKAVSKNYVTKHLLKHKDIPEEEMYKCDLCDYKSIYKHCLKKHQLKHTDITEQRIYKCDSCDYKANVKDTLMRHQLRHKDIPEENMYKCDSCDYKTVIKNYLKVHQLKHKGQMYKCDLCDFKTIYKSGFKQHQLKHKAIPDEQMYKCDSCDYKAIYKYYLKRHQLKHLVKQKNECDLGVLESSTESCTASDSTQILT